MAHTASEGQCARLVLRAGYWYVGETRYGDYREALANAIGGKTPAERTARLKAAKLAIRIASGRHVRLELRPWWPAFLAERAARLAAQTVPLKAKGAAA